MVNDLLPCLDRGQVDEDLSTPVVGSLAFGLVCKTIPFLLPIHNGTLRSRTLFHKGGGKDGLPGTFVSQSLYQVHLTVQTNRTLDGIEYAISDKYYSGKGWKSRNPRKVNFLRYADDFFVTADSEETAKEIKELIEVFLKERGLELSEEKTLITHIDKGFDFLGWNFRKYKGKLLIKPSKKSIDNVKQKISDRIKKGKALKQEDLIDGLNPIITGWTNYHQSVVSKKTFSILDNTIWNMLWKWAKRRHPKKSRSWIAKRYWHKEETRNWVFSTEKNRLKLFSDTKIVRHIRLKLDRNPYLDKEYFDVRRYKLRTRKKADKPKTSGIEMNNCSFA
jgi:RNA-directed DNA polymerase